MTENLGHLEYKHQRPKKTVDRVFKLVTGLGSLNLLPEGKEPTISLRRSKDPKPGKLKPNEFQIGLYAYESNIPFSCAFVLSPGENLVKEGNGPIFTDDFYYLTSELTHQEKSFDLHYTWENIRRGNSYSPHRFKTTLVTRTHFDLKTPFFTDNLSEFSDFGFRVKLASNEDRQLLETLRERRIPAKLMPKSPYISMVKGWETAPKSKIYDLGISLYLQDRDEQSYLKCYEVELHSGEEGKSQDERKNPPETSEVVPEAIWQEDQNHFCMREGDSFPLIPPKVEKMNSLAISVNCFGSSRETREQLLNLPLSLDGENQWFATGHFPWGSLDLLYNSKWGQENTAIVAHIQNKHRISPKQIQTTMDQMLTYINIL